MKKLILNVFLLISILSVSGSSYALDFIKFGTSHDSGFWGTPNVTFSPFPSTVQYLQQRGKNELASVALTDDNVLAAFRGQFGTFEAVVISESINGISPGAYALFNQFVSGGGCLILTGDHASGEDEFLNNTFGYSVGVIDVQIGVDTFPIQPGASGTQFAGGPANLTAANQTSAFSNTPGDVIYSGTTGVGVFTDQFGEGTVTAIGWDYCCTPPNDPNEILAWFEVINRAFDTECATFTPVTNPIPTLSEWGLIAMAGILGMIGLFAVMRRRKVTA
ncbi:MAG TPA: IPTL-CTERM sorting domain-containing protein [Thermodesulfobacteriota bacterium]|nr:IPTL-CTERM sorting domain-containing protein [Thermodesulfobacteriota bacterium]